MKFLRHLTYSLYIIIIIIIIIIIMMIYPLGGSSLLNYINYNYKINQIKLFTNYTVEAGLTESNYSKTN